MAKQHMAQPCGCLMAADPVWLDRDWQQPHVRHTRQHSSIHSISADTERGGTCYSMDNTLVPEQFVFLPFSKLHFCIYNSQQHWGSCSLSTPRSKNKAGTFLCSRGNKEP